MNLHKLSKIILLVIALVSIFFLGRIIFADDPSGVYNPYMRLSYLMLILAGVITLLTVISYLAAHPKALKGALVAIGAFLVVVLVAWIFASGQAVEKGGVEVISERGSKWADTGLRVFYFLTAILVGLMVYSGIKRIVKS